MKAYISSKKVAQPKVCHAIQATEQSLVESQSQLHIRYNFEFGCLVECLTCLACW